MKGGAMNGKETYNGWTNRATWNVNLWAMSDEPSYRNVIAERPYTASKAERIALAMYPSGTPDMNGPEDMDAVDWQAIAEAWNETAEAEQ
jgi:hypothetical protein